MPDSDDSQLHEFLNEACDFWEKENVQDLPTPETIDQQIKDSFDKVVSDTAFEFLASHMREMIKK